MNPAAVTENGRSGVLDPKPLGPQSSRFLPYFYRIICMRKTFGGLKPSTLGYMRTPAGLKTSSVPGDVVRGG